MRIAQSAANRRKPLVSMSVKCSCLIFAILSALFLTACGDDDVRFTRTDDGSDPDCMVLNLSNHTGRKIVPDNAALLYTQTDGEWNRVPFMKEVSWHADALILSTWHSVSYTIPLRDWYGELPSGAYQVRVAYSPIHYFTEGTGNHTAVYAFSVP